MSQVVSSERIQANQVIEEEKVGQDRVQAVPPIRHEKKDEVSASHSQSSAWRANIFPMCFCCSRDSLRRVKGNARSDMRSRTYHKPKPCIVFGR